jgi:hypothetical protein
MSNRRPAYRIPQTEITNDVLCLSKKIRHSTSPIDSSILPNTFDLNLGSINMTFIIFDKKALVYSKNNISFE